MNKQKVLSILSQLVVTVLVAILVILFPIVYLHILDISFDKNVAESAIVQVDAMVYWDIRYPIAWVKSLPQLVAYLEAHGFVVRNADELRAWMLDKVDMGTAGKSVVVMTQGIAPDTVLEVNSAEALLKKYLDSGGKIVWIGDVPMVYQGHPDGTLTAFGQDGTRNILGVGMKAWDINTKAVITPDGRRWGMKIPDLAGRGVPAEDVTTVLSADTTNNIVCSWHKNFNPDYPNSGFIRYGATPEYDGANQNLNEDVYQLAIYGFGK